MELYIIKMTNNTGGNMRKFFIMILLIFTSCAKEITYDELKIAVVKKDLVLLTKLINNEGNINLKDNDGSTLMDYAIENKSSQIIKFLIENDFDATYINKEEKANLLSYAILHDVNDKKVLELILNGSDVNNKDLMNKTPLMYACENRSLSIISELIKKGAKLTDKHSDGSSPIHFLALNKEVDVKSSAELLLKNGAKLEDKNMVGNTPLMLASAFNNLELVKFYLEQGAQIDNVDKQQAPALIFAVYSNNEKVFEYLLEKGASKNGILSNGQSYKEYIMQNGSENINAIYNKKR